MSAAALSQGLAALLRKFAKSGVDIKDVPGSTNVIGKLESGPLKQRGTVVEPASNEAIIDVNRMNKLPEDEQELILRSLQARERESTYGTTSGPLRRNFGFDSDAKEVQPRDPGFGGTETLSDEELLGLGTAKTTGGHILQDDGLSELERVLRFREEKGVVPAGDANSTTSFDQLNRMLEQKAGGGNLEDIFDRTLGFADAQKINKTKEPLIRALTQFGRQGASNPMRRIDKYVEPATSLRARSGIDAQALSGTDALDPQVERVVGNVNRSRLRTPSGDKIPENTPTPATHERDFKPDAEAVEASNIGARGFNPTKDEMDLNELLKTRGQKPSSAPRQRTATSIRDMDIEGDTRAREIEGIQKEILPFMAKEPEKAQTIAKIRAGGLATGDAVKEISDKIKQRLDDIQSAFPSSKASPDIVKRIKDMRARALKAAENDDIEQLQAILDRLDK